MSAFNYGSMGYDPSYAGGAQFPPLTPPPPVPPGSSGGGFLGGFDDFLNSNFMSNVGGPLLSAGLGGLFTNQAAKNYNQSARETAYLGGKAAILAGREAGAFSLLGEELAQRRRQEDAIFQLNMQKSKPFQDLLRKKYFLNIASQDSPGAIQRASQINLFG